MKLIGKLNALVMLFCLVTSFCADATNTSETDRRHFKQDIYAANDKLMNKLERIEKVEKVNIIEEQHQNFIEHKAATKVEAPVKSDKINFVHLKNSKLIESPEWIGVKKCAFKHGFLEIVHSSTGLKIELAKVRVDLTDDKLTLFTTMEEKSLFTTIKVQNILKVSQEAKFKDSGCFDILSNEAFEKERILHTSRITLCAKDKVEMGVWVHTLLEMKECKLNYRNADTKIVLDFNEINKIKKADEGLGELYYDNTKKTNVNSAVSAKEHVMENTVKKLIENMKAHEFEEDKIARNMNDKLKEAHNFSRQMEKKNEMIHKLIEKQMEKQREVEMKMATNKTENTEVQLIKAMASKISDMKKDEVKHVQKVKLEQIKAEKAKAAETSKIMMKTIIKEKRDLPYHRCTHYKVAFFSDKFYIKDLCFKLFGEEGNEMCAHKDKFCNMCCRHHVGVKLLMKYEECNSRCNNLIKDGIDKI